MPPGPLQPQPHSLPGDGGAEPGGRSRAGGERCGGAPYTGGQWLYCHAGLLGVRAARRDGGWSRFEEEGHAAFSQHPPGHFSHHKPESQATRLSWRQAGIEQMASTSQIPIKRAEMGGHGGAMGLQAQGALAPNRTCPWPAPGWTGSSGLLQQTRGLVRGHSGVGGTSGGETDVGGAAGEEVTTYHPHLFSPQGGAGG